MLQKISQKVIFSLLIKCSIIILVFAKRAVTCKLPEKGGGKDGEYNTDNRDNLYAISHY